MNTITASQVRHQVKTILNGLHVGFRWFVARIVHCSGCRRRPRYNPLLSGSLSPRARARSGGENRPMGREAHPRKSQCSLLSSGCPPTCRFFHYWSRKVAPCAALAQVGNLRVDSELGGESGVFPQRERCAHAAAAQQCDLHSSVVLHIVVTRDDE